ncbi:hypothetical protein [Daejeonella sp.]|uniref:hypothetical protein n=1 Tax=Daejeonella sp. TaxID=2805397 RepID=UPI003C716B62
MQLEFEQEVNRWENYGPYMLHYNGSYSTLTSGGALVVGVNKMSLGYALGTDKVVGEGKSCWVYQEKIWHGILFSVSF